MTDDILIEGAKNNNLKNVHVSLPKGKIIVVAGLSGSGKSTLVFDTLAAESQRLLNENYSSYIQQLLPHYEAPNVDRIINLPVSIIIDQKKIGGNVRSTVGTITEIYTGLRLLFSRIGEPFIGYSMIYSFNNPQGMCKRCEGIGEINEFDIDALIDFDKSLNEGAIQFPTFQLGGWRLTRYTESGYFDNDKKIKDYSNDELNKLLYDEGSKPKNASAKFPKTATYVGVIDRIRKTILEKGSKNYRLDLERVIHTIECPSCKGTRVNEIVRSSKINGKSIADCVQMPIEELIDFLKGIQNSNVKIVLSDLLNRLESMLSVGLGYLNIGRKTSTLSGGESQRIKMTKHLNSALSDVLYIFDEPSVGLHPEDLKGIGEIFKRIRDKGNTVVLVDHDPDIIKMADHIIEIGPFAGSKGGDIVFEGNYKDLLKSNTLTAKALMRPYTINKAKQQFQEYYRLENVSAFNVKHQSVKIPKNALTVVSGVAGSGKSTLIRNLFVKHHPESVVFDQSPIHKSNRSNLLTYLGVFDKVRQKYSNISDEDVSLFSFNGKGACPECKGKGYIKYDLAYMGDVTQECEICHGKRYNDEALSIYWKGRNIFELLQLTVVEGLKFIDIPDVQVALNSLIDANLGYIKLGQSLDTLSGGETQRLKIATKLLDVHLENAEIFILDEPSTGLHEADIKYLLSLLNKLKKIGKTLIVLEHNLTIISQADWIIDMGPKGGNYGGKVLFEGYPSDLIKQNNSFTGTHLRKYLDE
ncbi:excinuclease ABC subunit A [Siminovitchia terrae]|uniref:ATP-binding cassette domain-containing protein n=1 Tax=Siminovitchia terrae TaxID=1914933 RepID=UPI001B1DEE9D|nr:excinuclease ABC subunit UvrA [Siminovitchia terrae]GIN91864.1 excinuclease ABC subunit A [Siminovitchia terrae]